MSLYLLTIPLLQSTPSNANTVSCLITLGILGLVYLVLANLNTTTKETPVFVRELTSNLAQAEIVSLVKPLFPRSIIDKTYNWEFTWLTPQKLEINGYYLTNGQGCLVVLITGLIPGYILLKSVMEKSESITLDFSTLEMGKLTFQAKGIRAKQKVQELITRLEN